MFLSMFDFLEETQEVFEFNEEEGEWMKKPNSGLVDAHIRIVNKLKKNSFVEEIDMEYIAQQQQI